MRYSLYFYAIDSKAFGAQLSTPNALPDRLAATMRKLKFTEQQVQETLRFANRVCGGDFPDDCESEYFFALCWLAEIAGEKIEIPEFTLFRSLDYLDDIGIWPSFQRSKPPFAVPVCADPPPEVGFLNCSDIENHVLPEFNELPECNDPDAATARQQVCDVLESVCEDRLDVLVVLLPM